MCEIIGRKTEYICAKYRLLSRKTQFIYCDFSRKTGRLII